MTLGFPRIGARRELKQATEAYWKAASMPWRCWRPAQNCARGIGSCSATRNFRHPVERLLLLRPDARHNGGARRHSATLSDRPSAQPTHPNGSARCAVEEAAQGAGHIELDRYFAMARGTEERRRWK
jgi:hypothetical protein